MHLVKVKPHQKQIISPVRITGHSFVLKTFVLTSQYVINQPNDIVSNLSAYFYLIHLYLHENTIT